MNHKKAAVLFMFLAVLAGVRSFAQDWVVPEEAKAKVCPYQFTPDSVKKGEAIFIKNCQSCHGYPGKNNVAKITPVPEDPSTEKFQKQTDGEMFYRITTGKAPMPEFRNILQENDRWNVIAFLRSFNPKYIQPKPETKAAYAGRQVRLIMKSNKEEYKIRVTAMEFNKDKKEVPAPGVEIALFVKRYFGDLQIGDPKTTNDKGIVSFTFPKDLPGDTRGLVEITAKVNSLSGKINEAQVRDTLSFGVPSFKPGLTETRAWWNVRSKAPVWVILVYAGAVLLTWFFIFYILYMVSRIRKIS
jgi:mono/diheme cytochrome c family protein